MICRKEAGGVNERFIEKMKDRKVRHDSVVLADFIQIYCDGHHRDRARHTVATDGAELGVYGRKTPALCDECEAHLTYAEKRRAYCPQNPKPFCANCETHCYKSDEREWQRQMMRYSGPKSWKSGHAIDGIRHVLETRKHRKEMEAKARTAVTSAVRGTNEEESR
jgi:hypothetical protein